MTIPHVDRTITHIDRAVVPDGPDEVRHQLDALPELLDAGAGVRLESWPESGLAAPGNSFWAVHRHDGGSGHAVGYEVTATGPDRIQLRAQSDLYVAAHHVEFAELADERTEIAWAVTLEPDKAVTHALLEDAALLGATVLARLGAQSPAPAAAVGRSG